MKDVLLAEKFAIFPEANVASTFATFPITSAFDPTEKYNDRSRKSRKYQCNQ